MATAYTSDASTRPASTVDSAGGLCVNRAVYAVAAALVLNDTIRMCKLPADHVPVDLLLSSTDLDTDGSPALVYDVGIEDTVGATDDADAFIDGSTVGQAGGIARMAAIAAMTLAPVAYDRYVSVLAQAAPATGAASGEIIVTLLSRHKDWDD